MLALMLLQVSEAASTTPGLTVAVTLSGLSIASVGALLFKAGEWRGEHRALEQRVTNGFLALQKSMDESFGEVRQDIRDLRKS